MVLRCKECCEVETNTIVVRSENKMRFAVLNNKRKRIKVCRVDGCLYPTKEKRCDYLFILPDKACLVELKGKDRNRALEQLIATAEALQGKLRRDMVESYIVTSRVPRADTSYQKSLRRLKRRFHNAKCTLPKQKNIEIVIRA